MRTSLVLQGTYVLFINSLILQRIKDLMSFTNRPIFSVLVTLRVGAALGFSATEWTTQLCAQGMRNKAKTRPSNYLRPNHQRETSHEGNTQAKIRRDSAKVKSHQITMQKAARFHVGRIMFVNITLCMMFITSFIFTGIQWVETGLFYKK